VSTSGEPIAFLTERLACVESERDELANKAERLEALQRVFVSISAARDERAIAHATLRGLWLALGFTRAMWFALDDTGHASAIYDLDDSDEPVESQYGDSFPARSALVRCAVGESDIATGYAHDSDAPLFDTRGWYALAALRQPSGGSALLYADGPRSRTLASWPVNALGELTAQAALALEAVRLRARLEEFALHDPLTGLFNRRAMNDRLTVELARTARTQKSLGFALIDIDDFKRINDTRGHAGGDEALKTFALALATSVRETDVPARFAGDEFALIMPDTDASAAACVLDRFYVAIRAAQLSCSTGVAFAPIDGQVQATLFNSADAAVYAAKDAGKNTYRFAI